MTDHQPLPASTGDQQEQHVRQRFRQQEQEHQEQQQQEHQEQQQQQQQQQKTSANTTPITFITNRAGFNDTLTSNNQRPHSRSRRKSACNWAPLEMLCDESENDSDPPSPSPITSERSSSAMDCQRPATPAQPTTSRDPHHNTPNPTGDAVVRWKLPDPDAILPSIEPRSPEEHSYSTAPAPPSSTSSPYINAKGKDNGKGQGNSQGNDKDRDFHVPSLLSSTSFRLLERSAKTPRPLPPMPQSIPTGGDDIIMVPDDPSVIEAKSTSPNSQDEIDVLIANIALRLRAGRHSRTVKEIRATRISRTGLRGPMPLGPEPAGVTAYKEIRMRRRRKRAEKPAPKNERASSQLGGP